MSRKAGCMKFFVLSIALLMVFAFGISPVWAENEKAPDNVFDLGEVVVTEKGETITKVTTVDTVTSERIAQTNANNISDALGTLPGTYTSIGSKNERNIIIRGFSQRYVPVFLDGIPMYIPYGRLCRYGQPAHQQHFQNHSYKGKCLGSVWSQYHGRGDQHHYPKAPKTFGGQGVYEI